MISYEAAREKVMSSAKLLQTECIPLTEALGRVTFAETLSDMDMPPFNKSAMDGFAISGDDDSEEFQIIETIAAGSVPQQKVSRGTCSRIMTGAAVPEGADRVVRVEFTEEADGVMKIVTPEKRPNVCLKGEDIREGDAVVPAGTFITPVVLGVLASLGCAEIEVCRKPVVSIVATGSELVEPAEKPGPGQIRNSNSYQLAGQITRAGAVARQFRVAGDTKDDIADLFSQAMAESDIIILSGGVSMGQFDLVPDVLRQNGVEILFEKMKVKPGKPTVFGIAGDTFVFGLPGNPVSTFVIFELLVRPFIARMMGHEYKPPVFMGTLTEDVFSKSSGRDCFIPIMINKESRISPVPYHGSAHLSSYIQADGILRINAGEESPKKGDVVNVRQV